VKASISDSYHDYLVRSLQDPEEAAADLEAILEEENPEPELLKVALLMWLKRWVTLISHLSSVNLIVKNLTRSCLSLEVKKCMG